MLSRVSVGDAPGRQHAFQQRLTGAARLSKRLRSRVTLPAGVEASSLGAGERLPRVVCAFQDCCAQDLEDEDALQQHIMDAHLKDIIEIAQVEEHYVWDVYPEALAVQERSGVPAVGAAIDRRAFETTLELYNGEQIKALICFCCARVCVQTPGVRSDIEFRPVSWLLSLKPGPPSREEIGERRNTELTPEG